MRTPLGTNGVYRLYHRHSRGHEDVSRRLVGVFVVIKGVVHHMEDHEGNLQDIIPEGKLTERTLLRMMNLAQSPYWILVHEENINAGYHPELLDEK